MLGERWGGIRGGVTEQREKRRWAFLQKGRLKSTAGAGDALCPVASSLQQGKGLEAAEVSRVTACCSPSFHLPLQSLILEDRLVFY